jgi:hypothetical protein
MIVINSIYWPTFRIRLSIGSSSIGALSSQWHTLPENQGIGRVDRREVGAERLAARRRPMGRYILALAGYVGA